jgi:glyoxylase-like metal-dependent hydrolase (beta-lactamase superfamily II)
VRESVSADQEIGPQLRRLGLSPDDVRWVVLTHLHTDHAGGLAHFPKSEFLVSRTELRHASGLLGRTRGYLPHRWPHWFSPTPIDFTPTLSSPAHAARPLTSAGDVTLLATPGHTPGHVSVTVDLDDHLVLFAGDASYTQNLMLDGLADGVTNDERTTRDTLAGLRALAHSRPTIYLPSHDPHSPRRLTTMEAAARPEASKIPKAILDRRGTKQPAALLVRSPRLGPDQRPRLPQPTPADTARQARLAQQPSSTVAATDQQSLSRSHIVPLIDEMAPFDGLRRPAI